MHNNRVLTTMTTTMTMPTPMTPPFMLIALLVCGGCVGSNVPPSIDGNVTYIAQRNNAPEGAAVIDTLAQDTLRVEAVGTPGSCLFASTTVAGTLMQAQPCSQASGMHWQLHHGQLVNDNGVCMDATNPDNANTATSPVLKPCDAYSDTQQWTYMRNTLFLTNTTRCLTWPDATTGGSAILTLTDCDNTNQPLSQQWALGSDGFSILDPLNPNNCLRVQGDAKSGSQVLMGSCQDTAVLWHLSDDVLSLNNLCLDVAAVTPTVGTPVQLATCTGSANQQWFVRLGHVRLDALLLCLSQTTTPYYDGHAVVLANCDTTSSSQELWVQ